MLPVSATWAFSHCAEQSEAGYSPVEQLALECDPQRDDALSPAQHLPESRTAALRRLLYSSGRDRRGDVTADYLLMHPETKHSLHAKI